MNYLLILTFVQRGLREYATTCLTFVCNPCPISTPSTSATMEPSCKMLTVALLPSFQHPYTEVTIATPRFSHLLSRLNLSTSFSRSISFVRSLSWFQIDSNVKAFASPAACSPYNRVILWWLCRFSSRTLFPLIPKNAATWSCTMSATAEPCTSPGARTAPFGTLLVLKSVKVASKLPTLYFLMHTSICRGSIALTSGCHPPSIWTSTFKAVIFPILLNPTLYFVLIGLRPPTMCMSVFRSRDTRTGLRNLYAANATAIANCKYTHIYCLRTTHNLRLFQKIEEFKSELRFVNNDEDVKAFKISQLSSSVLCHRIRHQFAVWWHAHCVWANSGKLLLFVVKVPVPDMRRRLWCTHLHQG